MDRIVDLERHVGPAAVRFRHGADRGHGGLHEVGAERQGRPAARELLAPERAIGEHRAQVRLEHRRHVGRGVQQALHHVIGDALANRGVRHAVAGADPFGRRPGLRVRGERWCGPRGAGIPPAIRCAARGRPQHVLDGDAAPRPGAANRRRIEPALTEQAAHRRSQPALRCPRAGRAAHGDGTGARRSHSGGPGRRGERRRGRARLDAAEQLTGGDLLLLVFDDLAQHARAGRGDFDRDFVGLDLDERLVLGDALADLLEPAQDLRARAFGLLRGSPDLDAAAHRKAHRLASR